MEIFARIREFRHPAWWSFSTESVNSGTQFGRFARISKFRHPVWWRLSTESVNSQHHSWSDNSSRKEPTSSSNGGSSSNGTGSSWYDDRSTNMDYGGKGVSYDWSKNQYSGKDTSGDWSKSQYGGSDYKGGEVSSHKALLHSSPPPLVPPPSPQPPPLPAGFVQPPPPPSPSVPPTPPSQVSTKSVVAQPPMPSSPYQADSSCTNDAMNAATVRGSVGPFIQSNAAVVIKGETVLKRVGATRQPSSQASLPQIPSEQSRKQTIGLHWPSTTDSIRAEPETETSILNQMLTGYRINRNRKFPGGCTQPATGMPSESARIVKVDT